MNTRAGLAAVVGVCLGLSPGLGVVGARGVAGQTPDVDPELLAAVVPGAERFGPPGGRPRVMPAYGTDPATGAERLVGYAFLTSDVPPERQGYSGPVETLVGLGLDGVITGVRVVEYYESYKSQMGDFLRRPGHQEQYSGKSIGDRFLVRADIDGVSRATVSSRALARGVRDASRRVAAAYLERAPPPDEVPDPAALSWLELVDRDVVRRLEIHEGDDILTEISVVHIDGPRTGEHLIGSDALGMAQRALERRGGEGTIMAYGLDGPDRSAFSRAGWAVVQGADTFPIAEGAVFPFGLAGGGLLDDEMGTTGGMILPGAVDLQRAFTLQLDQRPERDVFRTDYTPLEARRIEKAQRAAVAAAETGPPAQAAPPAADDPTTVAGGGGPDSASAPTAAAPATDDTPAGGGVSDSVNAPAAAGRVPDVADSPSTALAPGRDVAAEDAAVRSAGPRRSEIPGAASLVGGEGRPPSEGAAATRSGDATLSEDDAATLSADEAATLSERGREGSGNGGPEGEASAAGEGALEGDDLWEGTDWGRTLRTALLLLLASVAFALKRDGPRWVTLSITFGYLGFVDGGFLSVSHITSALWVGTSAFVNDLPLLLMAGFTVITTLIFGRVFCGFLCPFGALQDILTRVVPRRFRMQVPQGVHRRALWIKYGVLAVILIPAVAGSRASIYPYFEPFGTVFFLSPSALLWSIALVFIAASVVVPRFYCRYVCPLGAALALGSLVAPKRIARVEHCGLCTVCERSCPTGAIERARIDFKECVRCNACETLLIERAGVCRHDIAEVRGRLVQLRVGSPE